MDAVQEYKAMLDLHTKVYTIEKKWTILKLLLDQVGGQSKLFYLPWRRMSQEPNPIFDGAIDLCKELYGLLDGKVLSLKSGNVLVPIPDAHKVNHVSELELYKKENDFTLEDHWNALKDSMMATEWQNKKFYTLHVEAYVASNHTLPKRNTENYPTEVKEAERLFWEMSRADRLTNMHIFDKLENKVLKLSNGAYLAPIPNYSSGHYVTEMVGFTNDL